jgi:hypothetical protein
MGKATVRATDEQVIEAINSGMKQRDIETSLHVGAGRIVRLRRVHCLGTHSPRLATHPRHKAGTGLAGFRQKYDPAVRNTSEIEKFLASAWFENEGYISDSDLRTRLRINGADWSHIRQNYEHLQVSPRDPVSKTRKVIWCHPDIIEGAREIAGRS